MIVWWNTGVFEISMLKNQELKAPKYLLKTYTTVGSQLQSDFSFAVFFSGNDSSLVITKDSFKRLLEGCWAHGSWRMILVTVSQDF